MLHLPRRERSEISCCVREARVFGAPGIHPFSEREAVRPLPLFLHYLLTCFVPLVKTPPTTAALQARADSRALPHPTLSIADDTAWRPLQSLRYSHPTIFDSTRFCQLEALFVYFRIFRSSMLDNLHVSAHTTSLMTNQYISKVLDTRTLLARDIRLLSRAAF